MRKKDLAIDSLLAIRTAFLRLLGGRFACPCCGQRFPWFTTGGTSLNPKPDGYCPRCNSKPRHRWLWLNLEPELAAPTSTQTVLHIAPARSTHRALSKRPDLEVISAGLDRSDRNILRMDLTKPALNEQFDLVLCIHVLEHLEDDLAAIDSLARLVKPSGLVMVGVPIQRETSTREDPEVVDPAEREHLFGEPDHRRWYGLDIVDRLGSVGFQVEVRLSDEAAVDLRRRQGLKGGEGLFLCRLNHQHGGTAD